MQLIYRRTPMLKCDNNFIKITLRHGFSPTNLLHIFRTPFPKNTYEGLLLSCESGAYFFFARCDFLTGVFLSAVGPFNRCVTPLVLFQKQPSEVFYRNWCSQKYHKIHRKTPVPERHF